MFRISRESGKASAASGSKTINWTVLYSARGCVSRSDVLIQASEVTELKALCRSVAAA